MIESIAAIVTTLAPLIKAALANGASHETIEAAIRLSMVAASEAAVAADLGPRPLDTSDNKG